MSHYANTVFPEQPLRLPQSYYRTDAVNAGNTPMPMTGQPTQGPHHQSTNTWSQHYAHASLLPHPTSFPSYIPEAEASASTSSYASPLHSDDDIQAPLTSSISSSGFRDITNANFDQAEYHPQARPLPFHEYAAPSQRLILPPASPNQSTAFPTLFTFGSTRQGSPSSHTSISDYGTGTKGWESPGLNAVEEAHRTPSHVCIVDRDGSSEQVTDVDYGSRQSSVPASTTTSSSSQLSVKVEPNDPDDCFVIEIPGLLSPSPDIDTPSSSRQNPPAGRNQVNRRSQSSQSLAPRAEVPLRATGASQEMRGMMGVFRLNPFAMHSLSNLDDKLTDREGLKELEAYGGEGQALEEEPLMFEFQLAIDGLSTDEGQDDMAESESSPESDIRRPPGLGPEEAQLRSFSPSFDLHPDDANGGPTPAYETPPVLDRAFDGQMQGSDKQHEYDELGESWHGTDSGSISEVDTASTPSRSTHTPLSEGSSVHSTSQNQAGYDYQREQAYPMPASTGSVWDAVNEQYQDAHGEIVSAPVPSSLSVATKAVPFMYGVASLKGPRLHTTTSHPYLRKSLQNQQALHAHSQSFSSSSSQGFSQLPASPQPGPSLLQPVAHRPQQSHQHITQQFSIPAEYEPHQYDYEQRHSPSYPYPPQGPNEVIGGMQHQTGPVSPPYMRFGRGTRAQEHIAEGQMHIYSPRNHANGASVYPQPPYTSPPANVQGVQHNITPNRRWSLPEAGGGHSQGAGTGTHFFGNA